MAIAVRKLGHQERISVVDHLDELRTRLIVSLIVLAAAFAVCFWQNHALLALVNRPLAAQTQKQVRAGRGPLGASYSDQQNTRAVAAQLARVVETLERPGSGASSSTRAALETVSPRLRGTIARLSAPPQGDKPVTLGIGEPFTTTIGITLIFALILTLPLILYQLYAFIIPALNPRQQKVTRPTLLAIPGLFAAGVTFGYLVVLPAAIRFFENFNSGQFNVLVQASQYYHFAAMTVLAMGLLFQVPVAILLAIRAEIVTGRQLRHNRRYAILACVAIAALLPGDVTTMLLETLPLYLLFEASLVLARLVEHRVARAARAAQTTAAAITTATCAEDQARGST
jgi:sec-independent protein translocase protein TatC